MRKKACRHVKENLICVCEYVALLCTKLYRLGSGVVFTAAKNDDCGVGMQGLRCSKKCILVLPRAFCNFQKTILKM